MSSPKPLPDKDPKEKSTFNDVHHLIIVCCHAIYLGDPADGYDEPQWAIEPFQKGETPTFIEHIHAGLRALQEQAENSLLVFSGAATKKETTPRSEGDSYLLLAQHLALQLPYTTTKPPIPLTHLSSEPHATDSYQNLLFSLLHFHTLTTRYPTHITIISHAFKRRRFLSLHLPAIRWPLERTTYVGIDPPEEVTSREILERGEAERGWGVWRGDLYGVGSVLGGKRVARGWRGEEVEMLGAGREEGVRGLLAWRGGESGREVFGGRLPWAGE